MGIWQSRSLSPLGDQILRYCWQSMPVCNMWQFFQEEGLAGCCAIIHKIQNVVLCNYTQDSKVPPLKFKSPAVHKYFLPHSHAGQAVVFDIWLADDLTVGNTTLFNANVFLGWGCDFFTAITLWLRRFLPNVRAAKRRSRRVLWWGGKNMAQLEWFRTMRGFYETFG